MWLTIAILEAVVIAVLLLRQSPPPAAPADGEAPRRTFGAKPPPSRPAWAWRWHRRQVKGE